MNEPIPGQGVFWSSVGGKPYPVPLRVLAFERIYQALDPGYTQDAVATFATELRAEYQQMVEQTLQHQPQISIEEVSLQGALFVTDETSPDILEICKRQALDALEHDSDAMEKLRGDGIAWGHLKSILVRHIPETFQDRDDIAYNLVRTALKKLFGREGEGWYAYRNPERNNTMFV